MVQAVARQQRADGAEVGSGDALARIPRQATPATIGSRSARSTVGTAPGGGGPLGAVRDLSVSAKMLLSLAVLAVAGLSVGVLAILRLGGLNANAQQLHGTNLAGIAVLGDIRQSTVSARLNSANHMLSSDPAGKATYLAALQADDRTLDAAVARFRELSPDSPEFVDFVQVWDRYRSVRDSALIPASTAGDVARWEKVRDEQTKPLTTRAAADLAALVQAEEAEAAAAAKESGDDYRSSRLLILLALVVGIGSALALGAAFARLIVGSLQRVRTALAAVARGDLTARAGLTGKDEIARMAGDLDAATASMQDSIRTIGTAAVTVAASAEELSVVNAQISESSDRTARQSTVMSSATQQVSGSVQSVADGAREMNAAIGEIAQNSQEAAGVAHEAVTVVRDTATAIGRLGESSAQIESVVKLITTIANQTNLLALNASIEAARAGEAGKGFAVVANEVKDLAQATTTATADISARVHAIQSDSEGAVRAIEQIGDVIDKVNRYSTIIASAVEEQNAVTAGISNSAQEASVGTADIAGNVTDVAAAAEATRSGVEGSQQASDELSKMAAELQGLVGRFTV